MLAKEELIVKIKTDMIEGLNLKDIKASDISDDEPLFGTGLGLDSLDALELVYLIERNYKVKIKDPEEGREVLSSVSTIADYIIKNKK